MSSIESELQETRRIYSHLLASVQDWFCDLPQIPKFTDAQVFDMKGVFAYNLAHPPINFKSTLDNYNTEYNVNGMKIVVILCCLGNND